jgi:hypothetical protein
MEEKKSGRPVGTRSDRRARGGVQGLTITRLGRARQGMGMGKSMYGLVCAKRVRSAVGNSRRQGQEPRAKMPVRSNDAAESRWEWMPIYYNGQGKAQRHQGMLSSSLLRLGSYRLRAGTANQQSKQCPSEHRSCEAGRSDETTTGCDSTLDWGVCACVVCVNERM